MSAVTAAGLRAPTRHELRIDVSAALPFGGERNQLAATVHTPPGEVRAILVCWPGGSYSRVYWDMQVPGHSGYSFAEHLAGRGFVVVAADPLGVGDSSRPADVDAVTLESMADAAAELVRRLRGGAVEDVVGPLDGVPVVGLGHSLGGCLTIVEQARHRSYDGVVNLGYTCGSKASLEAVGAETATDDPARLLAEAVEQAKAFFGPDWDSGYSIAPREPNHVWLHRPDVPAAVIAADDAAAAAWPRQAFVGGLLAGHAAAYAAEVTTPVLVGFGDHDVPARPRDDAGFYTASSDVTLVVLPDSAHSHNFAATRVALWDRIAAWVDGLPGRVDTGRSS